MLLSRFMPQYIVYSRQYWPCVGGKERRVSNFLDVSKKRIKNKKLYPNEMLTIQLQATF